MTRSFTRCDWFARIAAGGVSLIGCLVLAGWAFDVELLRSLLPGLTAMNPGGTACAFLLAGLSLGSQLGSGNRKRLAGRAFASVVILIAMLRLGGYLLEWDGGPDQFLFREKLDREIALHGQPNRMAPNTAFALLLVGLALLLISDRTALGIRTAQILALAGGLIALLTTIGYAYSAIALTGMPAFIPMAFNTGLALGLLCAGLLAARPDRGLMAVVASPGAGGTMARRLLPAAILIPSVLGFEADQEISLRDWRCRIRRRTASGR